MQTVVLSRLAAESREQLYRKGTGKSETGGSFKRNATTTNHPHK